MASWGLGCGTGGTEDSTSADPGAVAVQAQVAGVPDTATALALRTQGAEGLRRALERYDGADRTNDPQAWERFVDTVAGARDTSTARLFWETDLDRAKAAAERLGLPILSLRMLGDLRDELSCANSRFFRTTLYADPEVSKTLREEFVLHWSSERAVPVVEIPFGDGRSIKTTTTGNSIHYLLDAEGTVLDAAPGLYSPDGFSRVLGEMRTLAEELRESGDSGGMVLRAHHKRAGDEGDAAVARWLAEYGSSQAAEVLASSRGLFASSAPVPAIDAQVRTKSKAVIETPTLRALGARQAPAVARERALDQLFERLTELGTVEVSLSKPTQALMLRDRPQLPGESASDHEARLTAMLQRFQSTVATDELKNEYDLRISLHRWLSEANVDRSFDAFNERVYRELFLTPASDPWLGLLDNTSYDGLVEAGISGMPG
ncbi:MAG: hypothetical protein KUG77_13340 [Nannocystaceae bacterium]|nr:hypothetical protein [Nannocystaceae bacterium]